MKKLFYVSILVFSISSFVKNNLSNSTSRTITFNEHIAPIFYANCTGCHHNGGVGPFSLTNYQEAYNKRNEIQLSVISADLEAIIILNNNETIFGTIITNNFPIEMY